MHICVNTQSDNDHQSPMKVIWFSLDFMMVRKVHCKMKIHCNWLGYSRKNNWDGPFERPFLMFSSMLNWKRERGVKIMAYVAQSKNPCVQSVKVEEFVKNFYRNLKVRSQSIFDHDRSFENIVISTKFGKIGWGFEFSFQVGGYIK